jgi:hypothetical protein
MDADLSRWDREEHAHLDPERMAGKGWYDVQMKVEGEAALDVLRNFKHRWEALYEFTQDPIKFAECIPLGDAPNLDQPISLPSVPLPGGGPFLQITRTVPPQSCYASLSTQRYFVDEAGELGSYRTYLQAIERARKFILINDQYLFGEEIALAIHQALQREDGPEYAVILLPKNLNESDLVDPVIYKLRKRALYTLYYGAELQNVSETEARPPRENEPHRYHVHGPENGSPVADRVAVLTPINRDGDEIYVHSKQIIVDDSFMSIGSANFTFRGTTYEMELNASAVGRMLYKGGTDLVREQRIELCRRMLGLPKPYSTLLQDWNAAFHLFKALETQSRNFSDGPPTLNLHPLKPMSKRISPLFTKLIGSDYAGFDEGAQFVIGSDDNAQSLHWVKNHVVDVDGRQLDDDSTLVTAVQFIASSFFLTEFPRNALSAYGRISFDLQAIRTQIADALDAEKTVKLWVTLRVPPVTGNGTQPDETLPFANYTVSILSNDAIRINGLNDEELLVPLNTRGRVTLRAEVSDGGSNLGIGQLLFDPTAPGTAILPGSFTRATVTVVSP